MQDRGMNEHDAEQLQLFLNNHPWLLQQEGVIAVKLEMVDSETQQQGIMVYLDSDHRGTIQQLPDHIDGLPVIVKLQRWQTGEVVETIDLCNLGAESG